MAPLATVTFVNRASCEYVQELVVRRRDQRASHALLQDFHIALLDVHLAEVIALLKQLGVEELCPVLGEVEVSEPAGEPGQPCGAELPVLKIKDELLRLFGLLDGILLLFLLLLLQLLLGLVAVFDGLGDSASPCPGRTWSSPCRRRT